MGPTVAIGEELGLKVNTKGAGKGKVSCVVVQPDGSEVEAEVVENDDGTFDIFYTAPEPGSYVIYVRFGGENIPRSPFKVTVSFASFWISSWRTADGDLVVFQRVGVCLGGKTKKVGPCVLRPHRAHDAFMTSPRRAKQTAVCVYASF